MVRVVVRVHLVLMSLHRLSREIGETLPRSAITETRDPSRWQVPPSLDVAMRNTDIPAVTGTKPRKSPVHALPISTGSGHRDGRRKGSHGQEATDGVERVELEGL